MELTKEQKVKLYTNMVRIRRIDQKLISAFNEKKLAGGYFHSQQGQEAIGVGACTFLRKDDYLFYSHRGHGICELISKGVSPRQIIAEHYGKITGSCRGIGYINCCNLDLGIFSGCGTLGGTSTLAAGVALTAKFKGKGQIVIIFSGDGAIGEGSVHEALLMSANWKLPVVWLFSNNLYQMFVPTRIAYPRENIAEMAFGYNIPSKIVDGQDVMAVYKAVQKAVERARSDKGPSFIELKTYRFRSHMEGFPDCDLNKLRSKEEVDSWRKRDPIKLFQEKLLEDSTLTHNDVKRIDMEAQKEIEDAEKFALESPFPTPEILDMAIYSE